MEEQKFTIEIDGVEKEATILNVLNVKNKEILIYSVSNNDDTSDLFYSEIVKDEEGFDTLVDVNDNLIKERILELVNVMMS